MAQNKVGRNFLPADLEDIIIRAKQRHCPDVCTGDAELSPERNIRFKEVCIGNATIICENLRAALEAIVDPDRLDEIRKDPETVATDEEVTLLYGMQKSALPPEEAARQAEALAQAKREKEEE